MSCDNPMGGGSFAALNLPAEHVSFLRGKSPTGSTACEAT
jgi:hypothetical protein